MLYASPSGVFDMADSERGVALDAAERGLPTAGDGGKRRGLVALVLAPPLPATIITRLTAACSQGAATASRLEQVRNSAIL